MPKKDDTQAKNVGSGKRDASKVSAPGPTPGTAEGDRETVEQSLREKEGRGQKAPASGRNRQ
jgi:hypothetical protein